MTIGFTVREYIGSEIFAVVDGKVIEDPLRKFEDLREGMLVAHQGLAGGYCGSKVERGTDGSFFSRDGHVVAFFAFAPDDRGSWVCTGVANLRGLAKLRIHAGEATTDPDPET